jgi:hypothetical protein
MSMARVKVAESTASIRVIGPHDASG